jgi:hypothetical protein
MGWLSTLAKIGLGVAAPFTGGASLAAIPMVDRVGAAFSHTPNDTPPSDGSGGGFANAMAGIGAAGQVLGKQQEGAAAGRNAQAQTQQGQDRNAISLFQAQENAQNSAANTDLERKKYSDQARSQNTKQAVIAHLLAGKMPQSSISMPGITTASVHGGPLEALNSNPAALAALAESARQADAGLTSPAPFVGGAPVTAPGLTPLPQESKTGGFLDALAKLAQLGDSAYSAYSQSKGDN